MKFIVAIFLTALLAYTAYLFNDMLPWWAFALSAFIAGWVVPQKAWVSWITGFIGVFICWMLITWTINNDNHSLLSAKMAEIFSLKEPPIIMVLISSLVGAFIGGFASLTGAFIRKKPMPATP